jgi:ATP-dependent DNA ligase
MGLGGVRVPELEGTTFRGEAYMERGGKAIPFRELSGLMNSTLDKALSRMRAEGIEPRVAPFRLLRHKGRDVAPGEEDERMREVLARLPAGRFVPPRSARTMAEKRKLLADIAAGREPTTEEGVVLRGAGGETAKHKLYREDTLYFRGVYPGEGRRAGTAGGILASDAPGGEGRIRVGTGFTDEQLREIAGNSGDYVDMPFRVRHEGRFESGLLRAPSFGGFEQDTYGRLPAQKAAWWRRKPAGSEFRP